MALLAALSLWLTGCSDAGRPADQARSPAPPYDVTSRVVSGPDTRDIVIWKPVGDGPWPVVYAIPGVSGDKEDFDRLGPALAAHGAAVFATDYRAGGGFDQVAKDIVCGYRFVRSAAATYGGDPNAPVTTVGYSAGAAYSGLVEARETSPQGTYHVCPHPAPPPDVMVGMNGCYFQYQGNPVTFEASPPSGHTRLLLVAGGKDDVCPSWQSEKAARLLRHTGYDTTLLTLPAANHYTTVFHDVVDGTWVVAASSADGNATLDAVLKAMGRSP